MRQIAQACLDQHLADKLKRPNVVPAIDWFESARRHHRSAQCPDTVVRLSLPVGRCERFPEHIGSNEVSRVTVADEIHRMTVDEYVRIVRDFGWESTELIEGVVYDVGPVYNRQAGTVMDLLDKLRAAFSDDVVRNVGSVHVSPISMFNPDGT